MNALTVLLIVVLAPAVLGGEQVLPVRPRSPGHAALERKGLATHLQWAVAHPDQIPPPELRRMVRAADKQWLLREFRQVRRPLRRIAATWLLAYIGDQEVFEAFSKALRHGMHNQREPFRRGVERVGAPMDGTCDYVMVVQAMAVMAQTNHLAFSFLQRAMEPKWWHEHRTWRRIEYDVYADSLLAASCVAALGLTGRAEAESVIEKMRLEHSTNVPAWDKPSDPCRQDGIYQAKCYLMASKQMGMEAFRMRVFTPDFERECLRWKKSPEGLRWLEWRFPKEQHPVVWDDVEAFLEGRGVKSN